MTTTVEETLVLIKPDGVARNLTGEILARIEAKGYQLVDLKLVQPDRELLSQHYAEHEGKPCCHQKNCKIARTENTFARKGLRSIGGPL